MDEVLNMGIIRKKDQGSAMLSDLLCNCSHADFRQFLSLPPVTVLTQIKLSICPNYSQTRTQKTVNVYHVPQRTFSNILNRTFT